MAHLPNSHEELASSILETINMTTNTPSIHFRPTSWNDFSRYAKSLSSGINLALQKSQELLARAYGYSNLHELQQALKTSAPPGPFDDEHSNNKDHAKLIADRAYARSERINELVSGYLNVCETELSSDGTFDAVEKLCLFCSPADQRRGGELLQLNLAVKAGLKAEFGGSLWDYVVARNEEIPFDEYMKGHGEPCFTRLGQALYAAAYEIVGSVDPYDADPELDFVEEARCKLAELCEAHPENPWPFSVYLSFFGRAHGQMDWSWDYDLHWGSTISPCAKRCRYEKEDALGLLPQARRLIRQAGRLIAKISERPAGYEHDSGVRRPGGDGHNVLVEGLYWAGRVALNAGETRLAYRAFLLLAGTDYESFKRIRPGLGLAIGSILHKGQNLEEDLAESCLRESDDLESLAIAVEEFRQGRKSESAAWIGWALANGLQADQFVGLVTRLKENKKALDNEAFTGKAVQELLYRTRSVWAKEKDLCEFLTAAALDPLLQKLAGKLAPYLKKKGKGKRISDEDIANRKIAEPIWEELRGAARVFAEGSPAETNNPEHLKEPVPA